MLLVSQRYLC